MRRRPVEFGSLFQFIRNGMNIKQDKSGDGLPITRFETISAGEIDPRRVGYAGVHATDVGKWLLKPGDILISHINSVEHIGKCALYDGSLSPLVHGMNLLNLRPKEEELDSIYAKWLLRSRVFRKKLMPFVNKAVNQASVSIGNLSSIMVDIPPLDEQKRIAAILDQADSLRRLRQRAIDRLNTLGQAIFYEIFGDPVANSMRWNDQKTLGEVAEIVSGITKGRKLKGNATRPIPYLAVVNVQDKELRLADVKVIEATEEEINRYLLKNDDLLLTEGGDPDKLGRGTLWHEGIPECIHQNHIFRVRLHGDEIAPVFLNWLIGSARGKNYFLRSAKQTTGIALINMTQLRGFPLLLPPSDIQKEFSRRLLVLDALKSVYRSAYDTVSSLFSSLQHRAFRGEL